MTISPGNSRSIAQESGEIRGSPRLATGLGPWTTQPLLQPISFKSDRPLGPREEFKREAIKLVNVQGLYIAEASKKLDTGWPTAIASKSLRTWMKQEQSGELKSSLGADKLTADQLRIRELERELSIAKTERDILKKATAFFARESK